MSEMHFVIPYDTHVSFKYKADPPSTPESDDPTILTARHKNWQSLLSELGIKKFAAASAERTHTERLVGSCAAQQTNRIRFTC
jgi:hypothetical protein